MDMSLYISRLPGDSWKALYFAAVMSFLSPHATRHAGDITVCYFVCPQDFGNGCLVRGLA